MKTKLSVLVLFLCCVGASVAQEHKKEKKKAEITFSVNMHCDKCQARIEKAIMWEKSVKDLEVKLKEKTVRIVFDPRKTTVEKLQNVIKDLGYTCEVPGVEEDKGDGS